VEEVAEEEVATAVFFKPQSLARRSPVDLSVVENFAEAALHKAQLWARVPPTIPAALRRSDAHARRP